MTTEAGRALLGPAPEEPPSCDHPDTWFDRTICACGSMHDVCTECLRAIGCPLDTLLSRTAAYEASVAVVLAIETQSAAAERQRIAEKVADLRGAHYSDEWAASVNYQAGVDAVRALLEDPE
jgi:hypothetical protein